MALLSMITAPRDRLILLYLPAFGASSASWWPGIWSWSDNQWAVRTPFTQSGKVIIVTGLPDPLGWVCLPET